MRRVLFSEMTPSRRFGVELELSNNLSKSEIGSILVDYEESSNTTKSVCVTSSNYGWAHTTKNDYWHVKYDSTCGPFGKGVDHGWEVASYIGSGQNDIDHIAGAASFLKSHGATTNENCGLHVHVETVDYTTELMAHLLARWVKIENVVLLLCHPSRHDNIYCQTMRSRMVEKHVFYWPVISEHFWYDMKPTNYSQHENNDKRYAINTIGFAIAQEKSYNRNTIELRLPECDLNYDHVRNWTRLIVNFVEANKNLVSPDNVDITDDIDEVLYHLGLAARPRELLILDSDLIDLKVWFLKKVGNSSNSMARQANKRLEFISRF